MKTFRTTPYTRWLLVVLVLLFVPPILHAQFTPVDTWSFAHSYSGVMKYDGFLYSFDPYGRTMYRAPLSNLSNVQTSTLPPTYRTFLKYDHFIVVIDELQEIIFIDLDTAWPHEVVGSVSYPEASAHTIRDVSCYNDQMLVSLYSIGYDIYSIADPSQPELIESITSLPLEGNDHYSYHSFLRTDDFDIFGATTQFYDDIFGGWNDYEDKVFVYRRLEDGTREYCDSESFENGLLRWIGSHLSTTGPYDNCLFDLNEAGEINIHLRDIGNHASFAGDTNDIYSVHLIDSENVVSHYQYDQETDEVSLADSRPLDLDTGQDLFLAGNDLYLYGSVFSASALAPETGALGEFEEVYPTARWGRNMLVSGSRMIIDFGTDYTLIDYGPSGYTGRQHIPRMPGTGGYYATYSDSYFACDFYEDHVASTAIYDVQQTSFELVRILPQQYSSRCTSNGLFWGEIPPVESNPRLEGVDIETGEVLVNIVPPPDHSFVVRGNHLTFSTNGDLVTWDISDPEYPELIRQVSYSHLTDFYLFLDESVLVAHSFSAVALNDVSDLDEIRTLSGIEFDDRLVDVAVVSDRFLVVQLEEHNFTPPYTQPDYQYLKIYDIGDLTDPVEMGEITPFMTDIEIATGENMLFVLIAGALHFYDFSDLLAVDQNDGPSTLTSFTLSEAYPNPFNASVTIPFFLPQTGEVGVRVFNLLGQEVWGRRMGAMPSGWHRMVWDADGSGASSGVYILRLEANGKQEMRRVTLVR